MKTEIEWISCNEKMPNMEQGGNFLVIVKERWGNKEEWNYAIDYAWFGDYIDNFWNTCNDWCEGQEVHITHWARLELPTEVVEEGESNAIIN